VEPRRICEQPRPTRAGGLPGWRGGKETESLDSWRLPPRRATVITSTGRVTMRHDAWVVGGEDVVIDWFGPSEYVK
jgi:hypothetical protein